MNVMIYGHNKTIHHSKEINVEVDKNGKVVAVWFRCLALPFTQHVIDDQRADEMNYLYDNRKNPIEIEAIDYVSLKD